MSPIVTLAFDFEMCEKWDTKRYVMIFLFVFRHLWRAAVFSHAAAVSAAAVFAVGSAKHQKTTGTSSI